MTVNRDQVPLEPVLKFELPEGYRFENGYLMKEGAFGPVLKQEIVQSYGMLLAKYPEVVLSHFGIDFSKKENVITLEIKSGTRDNFDSSFDDSRLISLLSDLSKNRIFTISTPIIFINGNKYLVNFTMDPSMEDPRRRMSVLCQSETGKDKSKVLGRISSIVNSKVEYDEITSNYSYRFPEFEQIASMITELAINASKENFSDTLSDDERKKMSKLVENSKYQDFLSIVKDSEVLDETINQCIERFNVWFKNNIEETKDYINNDLKLVLNYYINSFIINIASISKKNVEKRRSGDVVTVDQLRRLR